MSPTRLRHAKLFSIRVHPHLRIAHSSRSGFRQPSQRVVSAMRLRSIARYLAAPKGRRFSLRFVWACGPLLRQDQALRYGFRRKPWPVGRLRLRPHLFNGFRSRRTSPYSLTRAYPCFAPYFACLTSPKCAVAAHVTKVGCGRSIFWGGVKAQKGCSQRSPLTHPIIPR